MSADHVPPPTRPGPSKGAGFGDRLRRSRETQGIPLEDVARRTRIAVHHLEALERSDLDALPAGPFAKAYVRAYAEVLGIDPEPVLAACRVHERRQGVDTPDAERRMLQELSQLLERGSTRGGRPALLHATPLRLVLAALCVVSLVAVSWQVARRGARGAPVKARERPVATPAGPTAAGRPTPASARPAPATRPTPRPRARLVAPSPAPPVVPPASPEPPRPRDRPAGADRTASPPTDALEVSGFGVGTAVVGRQLVGRGERFPEESRVVFWTQVLGGRPGHVVHHVWFQGGRAVMRADLPVRGPHWRTHSTIVLPRGAAGGWTVEARTSDGRLLARHDFVCEPFGRQ